MTTICRHCGLAGEHVCTEQHATSPITHAATGGEAVARIEHNSLIWLDGITYGWLAEHNGNALVLASDLDAMRKERDAAKPAAEWMRRTAMRLAVADEGDSLLAIARGLTGWVDRARATFNEYQDRALAAETIRNEACEANAKAQARMLWLEDDNKALRARLEQLESAVKDAALALACKDIAEDAPEKALEYLAAAMQERQS